ncbi:MAG: ATP-dependent DNA helicase RecG [Elusimicrobiota bacterium]
MQIMSLALNENVRFIKGVGEARAVKLKKLGIVSVKDLLTHYPQRYEDRRNIKEIVMVNDQEISVIRGRVASTGFIKLKGKKSLLKIKIKDNSGALTLLAFNQMYLKKILTVGTEVFIHGKFKRTSRGLETSNFTYEKIKSDKDSHIHIGRIAPVYPLTSGITQKWLRRTIYYTVEKMDRDFAEYLPENVIDEENLCEVNEAIRKIHFPSTLKEAKEARRRLVFGEFIVYQTALAIKKSRTKKIEKHRQYKIKKSLLIPFKKRLGFEFTSDQKRAINEIFEDMMSPHPMKRLLQGEVGSGKTVVALSALLLAVENNYLGVVLAPTEILAEQHFLTFKSYLKDMGICIELLVGNINKKERGNILRGLAENKINVIIGTHALLQEDVDLSNAGLMVIDEQHRFGVKQKAVLSSKSESIDVLAMSATPIPRTQAMCTYGDLDISAIKQLPKHRKIPYTEYSTEKKAYNFALKELNKGNQVYIVHPLIEESDKNEWKSAQKRFKQLGTTVFKEYNCGLLHGRMNRQDKENIMKKFGKGEYKVLFTTTVIEVGINVPKATVMIIENFNRYGLATLHQLRGRIARSKRKPYCFLTGRTTTPESKKRLQIMLTTTDGFKIAEEDLKLRGAGELFGTKQHGEVDFKIGNPVEDFEILNKARNKAFQIIKKDKSMKNKEYHKLYRVTMKKYSHRFHLADVS